MEATGSIRSMDVDAKLAVMVSKNRIRFTKSEVN